MSDARHGLAMGPGGAAVQASGVATGECPITMDGLSDKEESMGWRRARGSLFKAWRGCSHVEKHREGRGQSWSSYDEHFVIVCGQQQWNDGGTRMNHSGHVLFMVKSSGRPQHEFCSRREDVALGTSTNTGLLLGTGSAETSHKPVRTESSSSHRLNVGGLKRRLLGV